MADQAAGRVGARRGTWAVTLETIARPRRRVGRWSVGALAFASLAALTATIARYWIFTGFARYDDEGYQLISLKSFLDHGWRYDGIDGYGPFYYEFWGAIFTVFGIPVDHDHGRAATMVAWVVASLLIGLCTWRITGSLVLGLITQLSAFEGLLSIATEPMHPYGVIVLLLAAILLCAGFVRDRPSPVAAALLGAAVMALILVKVNVGVFALAAVSLVGVVSYPGLARHRWLRPVVEVGFVALPLLLMGAKVGEAWVRHYALHVCAAAFAVVIALRARPVALRASRELRWLSGGFLAAGLAVSLMVVAAGTSPSAILDGVILLPLRFPGASSSPLHLAGWTYVLDVLAVVGAIGYWRVVRLRATSASRTRTGLVAGLSILVGLFMAFAGIVPIPLAVLVCLRWGMLAFAWVALIDRPGEPDRGFRFARLLLPPLAVLQALHAYPVAGSQAYLSTVLLIPVGALCVANGVRWFAAGRSDQRVRPAPLTVGALVVAALAVVVVVGKHLEVEFDYVRAGYDRSVPLNLPGAREVRVSPDDAATYRNAVAAIDANCHAFVMLPRMNSFYLWTRQQPPAGYDPTGWTAGFDESRQQRTVAALRSVDGLCLLENSSLNRVREADSRGRPPGPMSRFLHRGFVPIATFGDYQLLKRDDKDRGGSH